MGEATTVEEGKWAKPFYLRANGRSPLLKRANLLFSLYWRAASSFVALTEGVNGIGRQRPSETPDAVGTRRRSRDVNDTDIFRLYSNSIRSVRVFIHQYPIPNIQYP